MFGDPLAAETPCVSYSIGFNNRSAWFQMRVMDLRCNPRPASSRINSGVQMASTFSRYFRSSRSDVNRSSVKFTQLVFISVVVGSKIVDLARRARLLAISTNHIVTTDVTPSAYEVPGSVAWPDGNTGRSENVPVTRDVRGPQRADCRKLFRRAGGRPGRESAPVANVWSGGAR